MSVFNEALHQVNQLTWSAIASRRDKLTGREIQVPKLQPLEERQIESRFGENFPVLDYLERALALAENTELAELAGGFATIVKNLRWSQNPSYNASNCAPVFLDGYAYAASSGPDAPIQCSVPRGGLFIMAPGLTYPGHNHEPREVYLVLTHSNYQG